MKKAKSYDSSNLLPDPYTSQNVQEKVVERGTFSKTSRLFYGSDIETILLVPSRTKRFTLSLADSCGGVLGRKANKEMMAI